MRARCPRSVRSKLLASAALLALLVATVGVVVQSAFTSTVRNPNNSFVAGHIDLSGSVEREPALFELRGLKPGSTASRCIKVTYAASGGLSSTVRLWGQNSGALGEHLKVRVTRGAFPAAPPANAACTGFVASSTTPLYDATLARFPTSYETGIVDTDPAWTSGDSAVYRIDVELADSDDAQGASATHEFVFEARTS